METTQCAGLTTERLDYLKNYEIKKKPYYNGSNYTYSSNRLHNILHHCSDSCEHINGSCNLTLNGECSDISTLNNSSSCNKAAGLQSDIINDANMKYRRSKYGAQSTDEIKNIIQNSYSSNRCDSNNKSSESDSSNIYLSGRGHILGPKRCLTRHIDDTEIGKYFSTKYAVTDKNTGRTEIMVERKAGSSNIIVQNFSAFDAYATFREENKKKAHPDSFVHTKMGIIPKEGAEQTMRRNKSHAMFTDRLRKDNIAPENYWLCPTVESENRNTTGIKY